ncbi:hypothetical protein B0J12DRAFT_760511 [Macrophomina phaseolina]|uniref:Methyltransferase type 12 domain-containing protein n=1 Tax=Macrophomina phaseolina TaxID=35725 RepID=A0ABQ8G437_9PEZI|nr:hypothetical protein B0J12DRAFT_760511 [Macrophomina phaseolina]
MAAQLFRKDVPWYVEQVPPLQPAMRELLAPFPCVGSFLFAELALPTFPGYGGLVERLRDGERYLEIGCGLGQDVRKLLHAGVPPSSLHATDLLPGLISAGHSLFRDASTTSPLFFAADFLDASDEGPLSPLGHSMDVIHASMFLHCFDLSTQHRACARIVELLKPKAGSTVVGRQGGVAPGAEPREEGVKGPMGELGGVKRTNYLHNEESFKAMWEEVGRKTGSKWSVQTATEEVNVADRGRLYFGDGDHRWLRFEVVRLE